MRVTHLEHGYLTILLDEDVWRRCFWRGCFGGLGEGDIVAVGVGAVLAAPLARLPPQNGRADELHGGEDDEADAGREEHEEPEEPGWRLHGNQDNT